MVKRVDWKSIRLTKVGAQVRILFYPLFFLKRIKLYIEMVATMAEQKVEALRVGGSSPLHLICLFRLMDRIQNYGFCDRSSNLLGGVIETSFYI